MTKENYLKELRENLKNVPPEEVENIMQYYTEYFEEAGADNADRVVAELGNPKQLAQRVTADYVIRDIESGKGNKTVKEKATNRWLLVLGIISSPILAILVAVVAIVVFSIIITLFALTVSFAMVAVVMLGVGVATIVESVGLGLLFIGLAAVFISLTILVILASVGIIKIIDSLIMYFAKRKVKI